MNRLQCISTPEYMKSSFPSFSQHTKHNKELSVFEDLKKSMNQVALSTSSSTVSDFSTKSIHYTPSKIPHPFR